jgi:hypothetical protein
LHLLLTLMREMRAAILDGTFAAYAAAFLDAYQPVRPEERVSALPVGEIARDWKTHFPQADR